ncbi:multicomponent K+:H+ antiporter subunit G [Rheinheimera pacifica]|uniref:Na+/H+ antiporter subunit G n=1 Tax=Rheinheimera pacifica TaxID=173990 RepID=UPI002168F9F9|nr:Na+/H+ antiporter subunit G [Rheinheimera pacifica]MCS4306637.1 multicomponent K+:H+ antiporter subunit G [Rheinheimera pacifica]
MEHWIEWVVAFFLLLGGSFVLIGSIGLTRMPDFFMRLHGPTKATTLGMGGILLGSIFFFYTHGETSVHELLITIFLLITAPISAHMLIKTALHYKLKTIDKTTGKENIHAAQQKQHDRKPLP